jgi:hypothetical protein
VETDWFTREFFVENCIDIFVGVDVRHVVIKYYGSVIGSSGDLIVTSSILLNHVLRLEITATRCQCQVWLWLAVALSWMQQDLSSLASDSDDIAALEKAEIVFYTWAHATLCANVLTIVVESVHVSFHHPAVLPTKANQLVVESLRLIASSFWVSMVFSALQLCVLNEKQRASSPGGSIKIFGITLLVLFLAKWHFRRQEKIVEDWEGNPVLQTATIGTPGWGCSRFCGPVSCPSSGVVDTKSLFPDAAFGVDETQWYGWNRIQTLQWVSQQFDKMDGASHATIPYSNRIVREERKAERDMVISKLALQHASGDVLEDLADISNLLLLHIPFGPACRLSRCIARLIDQYPSPKSYSERYVLPREAVPTEESCLTQHDQAYNFSRSNDATRVIPDSQDRSFMQSSNRQEVTAETPIVIDSEDHAVSTELLASPQHDRLTNVMKERFGLELPKIRSDHLSDAPFPMTSSQKRESRQTCLSTPPTEAVSNHPISSMPERTRNSAESAVPLHLINQMPPHIQDIAKRRPELVKQLLAQKQRAPAENFPRDVVQGRLGMQQQSQPNLTNGGSTRLPDTTNIRETEDGRHEEDDHNEDETTSLIHHEPVVESQVRYRSVDLMHRNK